jgi:hypothetical protein
VFLPRTIAVRRGIGTNCGTKIRKPAYWAGRVTFFCKRRQPKRPPELLCQGGLRVPILLQAALQADMIKGLV